MYSVFTKEMKKDYTILAPDIFPIHMELVKEIFRMYGYHLDILHYTGKKVVDTGRPAQDRADPVSDRRRMPCLQLYLAASESAVQHGDVRRTGHLAEFQ